MKTLHAVLVRHLMTTTIVAVVLTSFAFSDAKAQDLPAEDLETFEHHLSQGGQSLDTGDYETAIEHLDQARQLIDHPRLSVSIASAYLAWERCSQAESEFQALLQRDDIDDEQRHQARSGLDEARQDCAETATLRVRCEPASTELRIDGEMVECPFEGEVEAGEVGINASADGFQTHSEVLIAKPHETVESSISLVTEEIDEPPSDWLSLASYGALGLGSVMLLGGAVVDYRAGSRSTEIAQAQNEGNHERVLELESDASSARKLNAFLYLGGLTFVGGGLVLQLLDFGDSESGEPGFALGLTPRGVSTSITW